MTDKSVTTKICSNHPERETPLIWTFAWRGAEYWCPHCGALGGILGSGRNVDTTPELEERAKTDKQKAMPYIEAVGSRSCSLMTYEGREYAPDDLPPAAIEKFSKIIEDWKYEVSNV